MEENKNVATEAEEKDVTVDVETETQNQADQQTDQQPEQETEQKVEESDADDSQEPEAAAAEDKAAEYLDRLQRLMAEFDNFRKRSEKEKADMYDFAVSQTIAELLPVLDNFERALKVETTDKALYAGLEMTYKQLLSILEKLKVTAIETKDVPFDPNLHNAVLHIDDDSYGENMIVEELQKGYLYKEKVIRHSMVKVAN